MIATAAPDEGDELEKMIDNAVGSPAFRAMLRKALARFQAQKRKTIAEEFLEEIGRGLKESIRRE